MDGSNNLKLKDGSRVAVIGGGPAGSFFSYFLLQFAERIGLEIFVDIYEPRDYSKPGPTGCNMCAGVVSESLVQNLATEGIILPSTVVQRGIDSYVLHMDVGSALIPSIRHERRIGTAFRGVGPRGIKEIKWGSLDHFLMKLALDQGAQHIPARVSEVEKVADPEKLNGGGQRLQVKTTKGLTQTYDLLAVSAGVNTAILKLFQGMDFGYQPPLTTQCFVREYYLGEEAVSKHLGSSFHAFLLNIPNLDFAAMVPKGDYASLALLGENIDADLLQTFTSDPALERCMPPNYPLDQVDCWCSPRINIKGSARPYGDRIVFIGDSAVSRLYKDGIGAAYRAAKAAATAAIFEGVSSEAFERRYWPACRSMEIDNTIGKILFAVVREVQKRKFARRAVLQMVLREQERGVVGDRNMSMVMWDMLTGSAPYRKILLRTLHPVFWMRLLKHFFVAAVQSFG